MRCLSDDTLTDIAILDGKIAATGDIDAPARKTVELNGDVFVSAGWIDSTSTATRTPLFTTTNRTAWVLPPALTTSWWMRSSTGADDVDDF